ncbi:hypothetical protein MW887_000801 [Aspergillus wentii]|nr:hypothetical protein MW887_000801 [Aspergillus wentii]
MKAFQTAVAAAAIFGTTAYAIDIKINDQESIKHAAAAAAFNTMSNYTGNETGQIPGAFPTKWWEGAALFESMITYWHYTKDASNNAAVRQGMNWQRGDNNDFMPANYSAYIGNDDQLAWGSAALTAAELNFLQDKGVPTWLEMAENVFNDEIKRWDPRTCGGGLRWQIFPYQAGYAQKNAATNGKLFQLAARLAHFTGNETYVDVANQAWDWSIKSHLLNTETWSVVDTINSGKNCSLSGDVWSRNYGPYMSGAAVMYNVTNGDQKWKTGLVGLVNSTISTFFPSKYGGNILSEVNCEAKNNCDSNQKALKGMLALDLAATVRAAPLTVFRIWSKLQGSAVAAAKQCTGGNTHTVCGGRWYEPKWDGSDAFEDQLAATNIFVANLAVPKPGSGRH